MKDLVNSNLLNCVSGHLGFLVKRRLLDFLEQPPCPEGVTAWGGNRCVCVLVTYSRKGKEVRALASPQQLAEATPRATLALQVATSNAHIKSC